MKTLSLSEAKMKLSGLVAAVLSTDEEVVITKNGRPAAVLVSPDEFEGWKETIEVRSDPELMEEIKKGLAALSPRDRLAGPQGGRKFRRGPRGRLAGKKRAALYTLEELFK